ncbi:helicase IV [Anaerotignum neopropionicum]|uniref:DNA 3'-5' helicase n=1 Tax=Anaerotignum neopropionicum TaxID=36847 RepID=A0A136WCC3_9FIRM|nr:RNA polymerase recycling motor HelD [Anaerotignum neopropionicum]KXL52154.1 helicase IV [Anaerotignum neopropionicum]
MSAKDHKDYNEEENRLNETIDYIKGAITAAQLSKIEHQGEIKQAYIDLDYLDSSQSYASIMLYSTMIDDLEKNFDKLLTAQKKPYFARVDYKQEGEGKFQQFYIGKMTLYDAATNNQRIIDWRSPFASIYYDGRLGKVSYEAVAGTIKGVLSLKRQYTIENAKLENIMDVDITATDTFLQASLGENKDNRLKDIVATIQSEQNAIIRADINTPLVVQGVAGSGKTTIALHRIAYLIYTYEETFFPENFMILAPNRLFLNYISEVLPELGADKVIQTTFTDFIFSLIGNKYKLINPDEKLISIINQDVDLDNNEQKYLIETSAFKGSIGFKNIIDRYIQHVEESFVPDEDFVLEGHIILDRKEINNIFLNNYNWLPLYKRIEQVKKHLANKLKNDKSAILEKIENTYDNRIESIRVSVPEGEERRLKIVALINQRDETLLKVKKSSGTLVKKYISKFPQKDVFDYYREFLSSDFILQNHGDTQIEKGLMHYLCNYTKQLLDKKQLEVEDLSILAYMKYRILGFDKEIDIKYVVIDEAQDFSHFQFYVLKEIFKTQQFTILGDLSQGIHSYRSINNWDYVLHNIFDANKSQYLKLEQSYRTTIEIMDLANEVIKKISNEELILAKPVVRHGEKPIIQQFDSKIEIIDSVEKKVQGLLGEGYQSVALIGKTPRECKEIFKELEKRKKIKTKLLEGKEDQYDHNIVVVPSYLAKGLEFDAVIIINIDDCYKEEELDLKLLYVAMTRALHKLYVFSGKDKISFLQD